MVLKRSISTMGLAALILSACSGRLSDLGKPPTFTPVGYNAEYRVGVDEQHARIATSEAVPLKPKYAQGSLWNSGPSSLFGDRRAQGLGDIMTVVIEISDQASINNSSNRARSGSDDLSPWSIFFQMVIWW